MPTCFDDTVHDGVFMGCIAPATDLIWLFLFSESESERLTNSLSTSLPVSWLTSSSAASRPLFFWLVGAVPFFSSVRRHPDLIFGTSWRTKGCSSRFFVKSWFAQMREIWSTWPQLLYVQPLSLAVPAVQDVPPFSKSIFLLVLMLVLEPLSDWDLMRNVSDTARRSIPYSTFGVLSHIAISCPKSLQIPRLDFWILYP